MPPPPRRENMSVIYRHIWYMALPTLSIWCPSSAELETNPTVLFESGFPFRRLLRLPELNMLPTASLFYCQAGVTLRSVLRLLVAANVPSSTILVTLIKGALSSSETSVLTRATRRNFSEDAIRHSHRLAKPQVLHGFYNPEDCILPTGRSANLKFYVLWRCSLQDAGEWLNRDNRSNFDIIVILKVRSGRKSINVW
jgi:hypothetical protein